MTNKPALTPEVPRSAAPRERPAGRVSTAEQRSVPRRRPLGRLGPLGWSSEPYSRAAQIGAFAASIIAATALTGWFTGSRLLSAVSADYIPMAPNTAIVFMLLGVGIWSLGSASRKGSLIARAASTIALIVSGARVAEYLVGVDLHVDHWLFRFPSDSLGLAPLGRMAFFTALNFVFASAAVLTLSFDVRPRWSDEVARALALITAIVGAVFALGYMYGSPLMYGGRAIPMALPTAVAFLLTGLAICVPASLRDFALWRRAQARLRRAHDRLEARVAARTNELAETNAVLVREIAERRSAQEQLIRSQKMEAVGQLAGGIAHDFNNMLTAIRSFSELLLADMPEDSPYCGDVKEIQSAADKAAALTRQLLAFSRKQILQPVVIDLNDVARGLGAMLDRLLGEDIDIVWKLETDLDLVKADPGQIEQIIMNLAVNARDAMPDGGRLTIETANVEIDEEYAQRVGDIPGGPYVVLAVSDTGHGMNAATQQRVFEPFFTTKEAGRGTGLGLSTVYGIVKQSGGHIALYSEPDRGTTFRVYLPCTEARQVPASDRSQMAGPAPAGSETILVVEDDPAVRMVASRILRRQGYRVLEAPGPAEAQSIVALHPAAIDLVMTDVVLPEMGGRELADRLRHSRPGMKVLFMSGFTDDAVIRRGLLEPGTAFLAKPFTLTEVAWAVRKAMETE